RWRRKAEVRRSGGVRRWAPRNAVSGQPQHRRLYVRVRVASCERVFGPNPGKDSRKALLCGLTENVPKAMMDHERLGHLPTPLSILERWRKSCRIGQRHSCGPQTACGLIERIFDQREKRQAAAYVQLNFGRNQMGARRKNAGLHAFRQRSI